MKYDTVWSAVDNLAKSLGMTLSGLAKKSGLDSTTFNRSKRKRPDGKNRWPSLDSLNKVFEFCNITFEEFYKYGETDNPPENLNTIPYIKLSGVSKENIAKTEKSAPPIGKQSVFRMEPRIYTRWKSTIRIMHRCTNSGQRLFWPNIRKSAAMTGLRFSKKTGLFCWPSLSAASRGRWNCKTLMPRKNPFPRTLTIYYFSAGLSGPANKEKI